MLYQVSSDISSFSECLEFSLEFLQIFICPSKVISLAVSEMRPPRKPMSFFRLYLRVNPSESVALHLLVAHDVIPR